MAQNKRNEFNKTDLALSNYFAAIVHPARIKILTELAKHRICNCSEIVKMLPLAQSTVSQHLKELKKAGLINVTYNGSNSCYCLNRKAFHELTKGFTRFSARIQNAKPKKDPCKNTNRLQI